MKFIIIFLFVFISLYSKAQQDDWVISATKVYLPGPQSDSESYRANRNNKVKHNYRHRTSKFIREKKLRDSSAIKAFEFIKVIIEDSVCFLPFENFYSDSLDLEFLAENDLIKDSMIIFNFPLYKRQFNKPYIEDTCAFCLPIIRLPSNQIDGERLIITASEGTTELFKLNIGYYESAMSNTLKGWVITSQLYHKFDLFIDINLEDYFSRENMTIELQEYIKALKR